MNPYLASKNIETHSMLDFTSFLCEAYRQLIFIFVSIHLKKDFFLCVCVQHHFSNHFVYRSAASLKLFIRSFFWNQFFLLFYSTVHFLFFQFQSHSRNSWKNWKHQQLMRESKIIREKRKAKENISIWINKHSMRAYVSICFALRSLSLLIYAK